MTQRFWLLLAVIYSLLFLGMGALQSADILLAIPLLVYLGAAMLFAPEEPCLSARREISTRVVEQNTPVQVMLTLHSDGPATDELYLKDHVPAQARHLHGETHKFIAWPDESATQPTDGQDESESPTHLAALEYHISLGRGELAFQETQVVTGEHFGLLQRSVKLPSPGKVQALPKSMYLRKLAIRPQQTRGFSGPIPARQKGAGMSFWGVREYQMGDSLRRINWKVSARRAQWRDLGRSQELYSNEFEQERIADVGLILDAREQTNTCSDGNDIFEYAVLAAAALAEAFLADGHRVSLLTYGYGMARVYPGYGKIQRKLIMHALAEAAPGSNYALETLNNLPTRLFPARSQLVMISPLGPFDFPAFARLCKDGYQVLLVSPDPVSFEAEYLGNLPELPLALRLARLERSLLLRRLTRLGVQVVDWPVEQPLDRTLDAVLGRQRMFHRNIKAVGL